MSNDRLAHSILWLLETPGIGPVRVSALWDRAERLAGSPQALTDPNFLKQYLPRERMNALLERQSEVQRIWDQILEKQIHVLSFGDGEYPETVRTLLGKYAPPLLLATGNIRLLHEASVGFCGSRKASEKGLAVAAGCSAALVKEKIGIVSGYASGVDIKALQAGLAACGTSTIVLAEGIFHFRIKREIREVWDASRTLVVSEFLPTLPWSVRNAMQRNRTICALSRAMVLIEARVSGGSIEAGRECLKLGLPLFAAVYEGSPETAEGNRELLAAGGYPLYKRRSTNTPNIRPLLEAVLNSPQNKRFSGPTTSSLTA